MMNDRASERGADTGMRLQRYLARSGVASRRASEKLISDGRVSVNGHIVSELGFKVIAGDDVRLDGDPVLLPFDNVTIMLHKPAGYITTMDDAHGRPTVADLIPLREYPSLFPVGRLDMDTTGLLLFTTDGELGNRLLHPRYHVDKTYIADIEGSLTEGDINALQHGVILDDGLTAPASVRVLAEEKGRSPRSRIEVIIHEGRKRQVRRMLDSVGHPVLALQRTAFGDLELHGLESGKWRFLTEDEISALDAASRMSR